MVKGTWLLACGLLAAAACANPSSGPAETTVVGEPAREHPHASITVGAAREAAPVPDPWLGPAFDEADRDRNGTIDEGELALDLIEAFLGLDRDGDGTLGPAEIEPVAGAPLVALDVSGEGRLDFAELARAKRNVFRLADRDGDDRLSRDEVASAGGR